MIYSREKNYKYFIGYFDLEIKPFTVTLLKTNMYIKNYNDETK